MQSCIFCDTYKNHKDVFLFEDDVCFVILDKYPTSKGHSLVITKKHYENMLETPDSDLEHCFRIAKHFGLHISEVLGTKHLNVSTNIGVLAKQVVMHFHIHVIPRYNEKIKYVYWKDRELSEEDKSRMIKLLKVKKLK